MEEDFLNLMRTILSTERLAVFGTQLKCSLITFPLLTTKKVFFRGVVEELLFFLRGDHDNRKLQAHGVHIWDDNTTREYLDRTGKCHLEEHDLGLAYGVQWRSAGSKLGSIDTKYRDGIDQLKNVIHLIRTEPTSRRIIMSAWNVESLKDMALPPCHVLYQFDVHQGRLNCVMYQRSADVFLGLPFNIASTALLVNILANVTGLTPGEMAIFIGNAHIYKEHVDAAREQLARDPYPFPILQILKRIDDIEGLTFEDFSLIGYQSHPSIKAKIVV